MVNVGKYTTHGSYGIQMLFSIGDPLILPIDCKFPGATISLAIALAISVPFATVSISIASVLALVG